MAIPSPFIGALPIPQALDLFTKTSKVVTACVGKAYIGPTAELLQSVVELYRESPHQSSLLGGLLERCSALVEVVKDQDYNTEQLKALQTQLQCLLSDIKSKEIEWRDIGLPRALINQEEIKVYVLEKHGIIDRYVHEFQIASHASLVKWHSSFFDCLAEDNRLILDIVTKNQVTLQEMKEWSHEQAQSIHTIVSKLVEDYSKYDYAASQKFILKIEEVTEVLPADAEIPESQLDKIGLSNHLDNIGMFSKAGTSFDIRKAIRLQNQEVAVKFFRHSYPIEKIQPRLERMVGLWKELSKAEREYILPIIGYSLSSGQEPCIVTPWMKNGDILSYVKQNPGIDRMRLTYNVAKCLEVLHTRSPAIAHGLLKASNILISNTGIPLLSDLFLAKLIQDAGDPPPVSYTDFTPWSWVAPEIRKANNNAVLTTMSDIYSFGMVVVEIVTGDHPFACYQDEVSPRSVHFPKFLEEGNLPKRPQHKIVDDDVWKLLNDCWMAEPQSRPTAQLIVQILGQKLNPRV